MRKPRISIIGLGRVGTALLSALKNRQYQVYSVFNRSQIPDAVTDSHPEINFYTGLPSNEADLGELIFITTADDAIKQVVSTMSKEMDTLVGKFFVHCSGTLSSEALQSLKEKGANIASFHPMKSITPNTAELKEIWFDVEGDEVVLSMLENVADDIGSHSFRVEPEAKPFLHAAAVVASNYLVALAEVASSVSAMGNIPQEMALQALLPLMQNTLDNIKSKGTEEALTGPVARGDVDTVKDHLERLKDQEGVLELYKNLGKQTLKIIKHKGEITDWHKEIEELFS